MRLTVDKSRVTEGDIVEVKWTSKNGTQNTLTLDNGHNKSVISVDPDGSKRFKLNRVGRTIITISSKDGGKVSEKRYTVKVSAKKYDTYQRIGDSKIKEWWQNITRKFGNNLNKAKYNWNMMPKDKKQASISLFIIVGIMVISSFFPSAVFFGLSLLAIYCFYVLMKR